MIVFRAALVAFCLLISAADAQDERPAVRFSRDVLLAEAERLSQTEFVPPRLPPESVRPLTYDQYRAIRMQAGASIWQGQGRNFTIDLFHPGFIFDTPVNIHLVVNGLARQVFFTDKIFDYGPEVADAPLESTENVSYSGFRVRGPINKPDYLDEFLVFQGASYFRAVGRGQSYGLSARGLALRTARPEGEEFPLFTDFWIERPAENASEIVIHALLQSASVVGAYTFTSRPGDETIMEVQSTLFPRAEVTAYGIAPLTSMFLFDDTNRVRFDDFRAAVHDSDGLQIVNGNGERIWRPLANPRALQVSSFLDRNPRGFGLMQRKQNFADYQDYEARYERRPSLWIEPIGDWGEGHVELVEIPTDREINDNIVAYWHPSTPLTPGQRAEFSYRLRWGGAAPDRVSLARVVSTRAGRAVGSENRVFAVEFESLAPLPPPNDLEVVVSSSAGTISNTRGEVLAPSGTYRATFELESGNESVIELRLQLRAFGQPWSETWLYRWSR